MVDKALVIDMRAMKAVEVDAEALVVTAEGGCKLGEIDAAMEPHKIAVPWGALRSPSRVCLARSPGRHPHHPFIAFSSSVDPTLLSANTQHTSHNMLRCTLAQHCLSPHFKENHLHVTLNSQNNLCATACALYLVRAQEPTPTLVWQGLHSLAVLAFSRVFTVLPWTTYWRSTLFSPTVRR
jgi:hypothetical protein